jgi:hypothetical protein
MRLLAVIALLTGCEVIYEPEVGPLQAAPPDAGSAGDGDGGITPSTGLCGDSDPNTTVSFSQHVRPLLNRSPGGCTGCHGANATSGFSIGSYEALRRGGQASGTRIVLPGKPCDSILVQKLGVAPPFGARMPYNGPPFYTSTELTLFRDWVAEGALNN